MRSRSLSSTILCFLILSATGNAATKSGDAKGASSNTLFEMSEQLDRLDTDDFQIAIDKANTCVRTRDFSCAESELRNASKVASTAKAKKALLDGRQRLSNERALVAQEEARRQEELRRAEEEEERQRVADERAERRAREEESNDATTNYASARRSPSPFDGLDTINRVMRDGQRQIVAAQAARAEEQRRMREEDRHRAADERRHLESEAKERQRNLAQERPTPKQQPLAEGSPSRTLQSQAQQRSAQPTSITPTQPTSQTLPANTGDTSPVGNDKQIHASTSATAAGNAAKKTAWGPIQLEAVAICRQQKSKTWQCYGPLDNDVLGGDATLESALARQHCSGGTWAAGGPVLHNQQWDAYRCGHALGAGDYDLVKRYNMITAQRSYMCPQYEPSDGRCAVPYDGQDKR